MVESGPTKSPFDCGHGEEEKLLLLSVREWHKPEVQVELVRLVVYGIPTKAADAISRLI
jgi:hypothetical protein